MGIVVHGDKCSEVEKARVEPVQLHAKLFGKLQREIIKKRASKLNFQLINTFSEGSQSFKIPTFFFFGLSEELTKVTSKLFGLRRDFAIFTTQSEHTGLSAKEKFVVGL